MIENKKNQIGDTIGDHNQVIQIILSNGEKIVEKLGDLIGRLVIDERKEVQALEKLIDSKEKNLQDKQKIVELQDVEIIRLKTELSDKNEQLEESEKRFSEIFIENNGNDFSGSNELYAKALEALTKGNKQEALKILERQKLLEQKRELDREKKQQAKSWLLRADLLKGENQWGEQLNECYHFAVQIQPSFENNLTAANYYQFINDYAIAEEYYKACLQKVETESEKATTLNNLGALQSDKNEFEKSEDSYEEALRIYRKLAESNPQTYLPDVGMTQINMAIFYKTAKVNRELSIQFIDEAIVNLIPFHEIPYIQDYLQTAFSVLQNWDIDVEQYIGDKFGEDT